MNTIQTDAINKPAEEIEVPPARELTREENWLEALKDIPDGLYQIVSDEQNYDGLELELRRRKNMGSELTIPCISLLYRNEQNCSLNVMGDGEYRLTKHGVDTIFASKDIDPDRLVATLSQPGAVKPHPIAVTASEILKGTPDGQYMIFEDEYPWYCIYYVERSHDKQTAIHGERKGEKHFSQIRSLESVKKVANLLSDPAKSIPCEVAHYIEDLRTRSKTRPFVYWDIARRLPNGCYQFGDYTVEKKGQYTNFYNRTAKNQNLKPIIAREIGLLDYCEKHQSKTKRAFNAAQKKLTAMVGNLPDGRYAIDGQTHTNDFYKISRENGWLQISQLKGGDGFIPIYGLEGGESWYDKVGRVCKEIRRTPVAAAQRYAEEFCECFACGLPLTDDESRSYGIGPTCREEAEKFGMICKPLPDKIKTRLERQMESYDTYDLEKKRELAKDKKTPVEVLTRIGNEETDVELLVYLTANKKCPGDVLAKLEAERRDYRRDDEIRYHIAGHKNTPDEVINAMCENHEDTKDLMIKEKLSQRKYRQDKAAEKKALANHNAIMQQEEIHDTYRLAI